VSTEIEALPEQDDSQRLMTVPGVGPIISSAVVAAIGNGVLVAAFGDLAQDRAIPRRLLLRHETEPGAEVASLLEAPVARRLLLGTNAKCRQGSFMSAIGGRSEMTERFPTDWF
jgi:hypothetical protein